MLNESLKNSENFQIRESHTFLYFYLLFIFMCKMISINNDNLKEFINLNLVRRPFFIFSSSFC